MLAFFVKKLVFFVQKSTFTQSNSVRAMLKIFKFCFQVLYGKRLLLLKTYFCRLCVRNPASGLLKLAKIRKMTMTSQFFDMTSTSQFFWCCFVSLVNFSYWSKFHVNIITDSRIMTIFFYKGLTRNPEIGNTPVWVLPNIWRLGWVRDTKFDMNVYNKMLLNARVTAFTVSKLLRENQSKATPPIEIRVDFFWRSLRGYRNDCEYGKFVHLFYIW